MSAKPRSLEDRYSIEFETIDKDEWHKIINQFSDANLFQTWSYDAVRYGEENISHFVLRAADKIIAAAQARIVGIPVLGLGAAYIRWGPVWQLRNETADPSIFRLAVRALRNEYVCRRGLILRVFPLLYDDNSNLYLDMLLKEGYTRISEKDR